MSVGAATGNGFVGALPRRKWHFNVRCAHPPLEVVLKAGAAGEETLLTAAGSVAQLDALDAQGKGGWYHDRNVQAGAGGVLMVRTPSMAARDAFAVVLSAGEAFRHIVAEACDTIKHHQRLPQLFDYDAAAKRITLRPTPSTGMVGGLLVSTAKRISNTASNTTVATGTVTDESALCVTVGKDKEPASGTPALELQPCAAGRNDQQWTINAASAGGQIISIGSGACIDLDSSDGGLEMYSCHSATTSGNQQFSFNDGGSGHVVTSSGLCWAALDLP